MKKIIVLFILFLPFTLLGQESGIRFENGLSWDAVKAKAKAQNKYIFMDCYATWCGPCKWMAQNVFTDKMIADKFNSNFINVAVQMDRTASDNQEVKNWYSDAKQLSNEYQVNEYPTYLFFTPEGQVIHRVVGTSDASQFLSHAENALHPEKQYYTILGEYKQHLTDSLYLLRAVHFALDASDQPNAALLTDYFLKSISNPITKENIQLISDHHLIKSTQDPLFVFYLRNAGKIDALWNDNGWTAFELKDAIFDEKIKPLYTKTQKIYWRQVATDITKSYPILGDTLIHLEEGLFMKHIQKEIWDIATGKSSPAWDVAGKMIKAKYPAYDFSPALAYDKIHFYSKYGLWDACAKGVYEYLQPETMKHMSRLDKSMSSFNHQLNDMLWYNLFLHCSDQKTLKLGTKWMKWLVSREPTEGMYLDTYAQFLYKTGSPKREILEWEQKAIDAMKKAYNASPSKSKEGYLKDMKETIAKINSNQPTWEDSSPVPNVN